MDAEELKKLKERREIDNARRAKRKRVYYCTFSDDLMLGHAQRSIKKIEGAELSARNESYVSYPRHACFVVYFPEHSGSPLSELEEKIVNALIESGLKLVGNTRYGANTAKRINLWVQSECKYSELPKTH